MNKLLLTAKYFSILVFAFFVTDTGLFRLANQPEEGINNTTSYHPRDTNNRL